MSSCYTLVDCISLKWQSPQDVWWLVHRRAEIIDLIYCTHTESRLCVAPCGSFCLCHLSLLTLVILFVCLTVAFIFSPKKCSGLGSVYFTSDDCQSILKSECFSFVSLRTWCDSKKSLSQINSLVLVYLLLLFYSLPRQTFFPLLCRFIQSVIVLWYLLSLNSRYLYSLQRDIWFKNRSISM